MLSVRNLVIRSRFAVKLENCFLAYVAEACQHLAVDRLLILEDGEGPELESPLLELEQRDRSVPCPAVAGKTVNEERPGNPVYSAIYSVHPAGIVLGVAPIEIPTFLGVASLNRVRRSSMKVDRIRSLDRKDTSVILSNP